MPEEENKKPSQKSVDIDTSGPGAEIDVAEEKVKEEGVVETEAKEPEIKEEETETVKEIKKEQKQDDEQLEEYSKGVQSRISKLTRKMREAERQRDAATEYARAADDSRKTLEKRFVKTDSDYIKRFESSVKEGMDSAQKDLARAIESGDAKAQVEANKKIATLAFDNARLEQSKEMREAPATPGRKTVRLTSSQVAIAKKLGVPLEDYAKQLKNTKGVV
jgi:hypothetical protein